MNRTLLKTLTVLALVLACVTGFSAASISASGPPVRSIVVFDDAVNAPALAKIEALGAVKIKDLPLVNGAAVWLPSKASEKALSHVEGVKYVESDAIAYAIGKPTKPAPTSPPQVLPWGVDRVEAEVAKATTTGDTAKVAVVDTGIDLTHPDLAVNIKGGMSAVNYTRKYTDDNGHGTHVAGIIAAVDNTIGVVGVGPKIDLYAVKVLNRSGSGYISDIIEGLGWCQQMGMDVVNMSLGASVDVSAFGDACTALYNSGTVIVAAAGNDGNGAAVNYPAAYPDVIAVGATTQTDGIAYFSCTGPQVELAAPGYEIYSTYKGGKYATMSGTSMASPHVAGVAALVASLHPTWNAGDVRTRLDESVDDRGAVGRDPVFGYGIVRADLAVAQ